MWQIRDFKPFEERDTNYGKTYADAQGRLYKIDFTKRFAGKTSRCYYPGDSEYDRFLAEVIDVKLQDPEAGLWIKSIEGIVAELLQVTHGKSKKSTRRVFIGSTIFGMNCFNYPPTLFVDRVSFWRLGNVDSKTRGRITGSIKELLLCYVKCNFDTHRAWEMYSGHPLKLGSKYYARYRIKEILKSPEAMKFFMATVADELKRLGVSPEVWAKKMVESVPGLIENEVQRKIWEQLGYLNPEIRRELTVASGEAPDNPNDGKFTLPPAKDAEFKDVCSLCNGTKIYTAKTPDGQEVQAICPQCGDDRKLEESNGKENGLALRV
jgi:hypothetical protein